jgi:hypothetical protein
MVRSAFRRSGFFSEFEGENSSAARRHPQRLCPEFFYLLIAVPAATPEPLCTDFPRKEQYRPDK